MLQQQAQVSQEQRRSSLGGDGAKADPSEARKLRETIKSLQEENEELRAELNSFDPGTISTFRSLIFRLVVALGLLLNHSSLISFLSV
jgi:hypothetical protein